MLEANLRVLQEGLEEYEKGKEMLLSQMEKLERELLVKVEAVLEETLPRWGIDYDMPNAALADPKVVFACPGEKVGDARIRRYQYIYDSDWNTPNGGLLEELLPSVWKVLLLRGCRGGRLLDKMRSIRGIPSSGNLVWIDVTQVKNPYDIYNRYKTSFTIALFPGSPLKKGHRYYGPVTHDLALHLMENGRVDNLPCYWGDDVEEEEDD